MKRSFFIFDSVQLFYYKYHKIDSKHDGSYIDFPDWIRKKKATTNLKNTDDQCFQYNVTVALNYGEIKWSPERVPNIIHKYYHTKIDDWKTFKKNNPTIALIILYIKGKEVMFSLYFKTKLNPWKTNNFLNGSKWRKRRMKTLSSNKKIICIIW